MASSSSGELIKPSRLLSGDVVGLISPASPYSYEVDNPVTYLEGLNQVLNGILGLEVKYGPHMNETYGYLAGNDSDRASDVNQFFADPNVKFLLANRGGYGCGRILDLIDYEMIKKNPKIIMGYSDLTALLNAIYFQTNMVTYYGPMGIDNWHNENLVYAKKVLFDGESVMYSNPSNYSNIKTIVPGKSKGKLLGGNLSVFVSLLGSKYVPIDYRWEEVILFLEDIGEEPYRIDRMINSLSISGILPRLSGFIWGICTKCEAVDPSRSFTVDQVLEQYLGKLQQVPSFSGFMFGHISQQFTFPLGISAYMDSTSGTVQLLETPVS